MHPLHRTASKCQIRLAWDPVQRGRVRVALRDRLLARCDAGDDTHWGGLHALHNGPLPQRLHQDSLPQLG